MFSSLTFFTHPSYLTSPPFFPLNWSFISHYVFALENHLQFLYFSLNWIFISHYVFTLENHLQFLYFSLYWSFILFFRPRKSSSTSSSFPKLKLHFSLCFRPKKSSSTSLFFPLYWNFIFHSVFVIFDIRVRFSLFDFSNLVFTFYISHFQNCSVFCTFVPQVSTQVPNTNS